MNLLLYIMVLLFVIASISYQALNHYRTGALLRSAWEYYMRIERGCDFNQQIESEYRMLRRSVGKNGNEEAGNSEGIEAADRNASATINFRYLTKQQLADTHPNEAGFMVELIKRLIQFLYGHQSFYKEAVQENPALINDLISELRQVEGNLPPTEKVNRVSKLNRLPLTGATKEFWYQLLRNNPADVTVLALFLQKKPTEINLQEECIQISLKDYLNEKNAIRLRVYLAPYALLYAILQDEKAVFEVSEERKKIYREAKRSERDLSALSEQFKQFCLKYPEMQQFEPVLSFHVTATNPRDYEE